MKYEAVFSTRNGPEFIDQAYSQETQRALQHELNFLEPIYDAKAPDNGAFRHCRYLFSTWGIPEWDESYLARNFPELEAVFYAAGSVQHFTRPFFARGVRVFAAASINAIPVADYCLAEIILASKGHFTLARERSQLSYEDARALAGQYPGSYQLRIGLVGFGKIARLLCEKIHLVLGGAEVYAYDPFVDEATMKDLGAIKLDRLEVLFERCQIVSNHLPNLPATQKMLGRGQFKRLPSHACFINTGRGAQVIEEELVDVLRERPDLSALLDVTWPEPPVPGHPFYELPNVFLTPHIAGSSGLEIQRMGDAMFEAWHAVRDGEDCAYEVLPQELSTMA